MKLRILGNSLRVRLSVPETKHFEKYGLVSDEIRFGTATLVYQLEISHEAEISADFRENVIRILIPEKMARDWVNSELVGMESMLDLEQNETLKILVEKDFTCLIPREGENENELFPNPKAGPDQDEANV